MQTAKALISTCDFAAFVVLWLLLILLIRFNHRPFKTLRAILGTWCKLCNLSHPNIIINENINLFNPCQFCQYKPLLITKSKLYKTKGSSEVTMFALWKHKSLCLLYGNIDS